MRAFLALEDGTVFEGRAFGAEGETSGEVVFNTSLTGYQEALTDPSYCGQILTMTYPLVGNYGVNPDDTESSSVQVKGLLIRELSPLVSNFRSTEDLHHYLKRQNVLGMEGFDTRALVRKLRIKGSLRGVLSTTCTSATELVTKAKAIQTMTGQDLVREVTPKHSSHWNEGLNHPLTNYLQARNAKHKVVAVDFGMKRNILKCLTQVGCEVTVVPGTITAAEILALKPEGVFLSNGPGDPAAVTYAVETIKGLVGKVPVFGICLGHQLLSLALGAKTFKLKFGHRGSNQPVRNENTGRVEITCQNHGFAVEKTSLPQGVEVSHLNLNDNTVEGIRHQALKAFSVQYHPEASAGPHDSSYLFEDFVLLMETGKMTQKV